MAFVTLPRFLLAVSFSLRILSRVVAQAVAPSNATANTSAELVLSTTLNRLSTQFSMSPLTNSAGLSGNISEYEEDFPAGPLALTTLKSVEFLQAGDIAYVSCEPSDYSEGNISAGSTISLAVNAKPEAIVLYSVYAYTCNFSPSAEFQDLLIYTMQNASSSTAVVDGLQRNNPPYPYTTIFENQTSSTEAVDSQTSSTGTPKKENLITGLVFGFVTPIPVVALGLYYVCITRRRPPRKQQITPAKPSGKKPHVEEDSAQLYLQRKAELDDEQRRHEMEVVEIRCEMDGENEIHEMPAEARGRHFGRQELRGKEHSVEMESAL